MSYQTPLEILKSFQRDQLEYVVCEIKGTLPVDLPDGSLLLNGPGVFQFGEDAYKTALDGMAALQQYEFRSGRVRYRSRIIDSDSYKKNKAAGAIVVHEIGTLARPDPNKSFIRRYWNYFTGTILQPTDNTVVNVVKLNESYFALTETPFINELSVKDLTVKNKINLRDYVPVHILTAHPLKDKDGILWNIGTSFSLASKYCVLKTPADGGYERTKVVGSTPCRWGLSPSYYHSFGMSENFLILIEQCVCMPLMSMASATFRQKSFAELMMICTNEPCIINVFDKRQEKFLSVRFSTEPFITLHHVNAYEDSKDQLIVDVCVHTGNSFLQDFELENFSSGKPLTPVEIWRFTLPISTCVINVSKSSASSTSIQPLIETTPLKFVNGDLELPRINMRYDFKSYRYVYGVKNERYDKATLLKFDFHSGDAIIWSEEHCIPGTPVFIESTRNTLSEDSGYILAPVMSQDPNTSHFLLVLDARTMSEVCRILLPTGVDVPYTFHGIFEKLL